MPTKFYTQLDLTTDNKIVNLKDPTLAQDAATKKYVDGLLAALFVWSETPGGAINGANAAFTLLYAPLSSGTMMLFKNGILQRVGAGNDFTFATLTITFLAGNIPQTNDVLTCTYQR